MFSKLLSSKCDLHKKNYKADYDLYGYFEEVLPRWKPSTNSEEWMFVGCEVNFAHFCARASAHAPKGASSPALWLGGAKMAPKGRPIGGQRPKWRQRAAQ